MEYVSEILSFLGGLVAGITVKVVYDKRSVTKINSKTTQSGNVVGGDQAGRDITKIQR